MSIIKSILHKYNATSKAYDTLHPETESAQITDWNQGIVNTLASTALGGLVNTLTSDSLLAKMIQKVLTATGVKYNIDQNGYICFGSLFGGLIIQWGSTEPKSVSNNNINITQLFPIEMGKTLNVFTTIYDTTKSEDYNGGISADVTSYDNKGLTMVLDVVDIQRTRVCQIFFLALGI